MRLIKLPVNKVSPRAGVSHLVSKAKTILREFCTRALIDLKLVPKSFVFEFDFHDSRRSTSKAIDRMASIIKRAVIKAMPFVEHTNAEFMTGLSGRGIKATLTLPPRKSDLPYGGAASTSACAPEFKALNRYAEYVQYRSMKDHLPIRIQIIYESSIAHEEAERLHKLSARELKLVKNYPVVNPVITVFCELVNYSSGGREMPLKDYMEALSPGNPELAYLRADRWTYSLFKESCTVTYQVMDGWEKFRCVERVFTILPNIIKFYRNLARKTEYGFQPFSIACAPGSRDQQ